MPWRRGAVVLLLALAGCAATRAPLPVSQAPALTPGKAALAAPPPPTPTPPARPQLPRGGRTIFPEHRLVGYCGTPGGAPALGRLSGNLATRAQEIETLGKKYASKRKVLPVFELIAVIVQGVPGADGKYRRRVSDETVADYLKAARAAKAILLLNVQPGHSDFMTEVRSFAQFLKEPDVGVALDPEWSMKPKQKPGVYYGQSTGPVVNEVSEYLAGFVKEHDLPEKVLVVHQMNSYVFKEEEKLAAFPGVVLIKSVDGLGPKGAKINTYNFLMKTTPDVMHAGFKLFFDEDTMNGRKLMSPEEVLALKPEPEYVMYE